MKLYLLDGPLMTTPERRRETLERMARDLVRHGVPHNDREAVRMLCALNHHHLEVAILAGEARMLAYQEIVAQEMMKP